MWSFIAHVCTTLLVWVLSMLPGMMTIGEGIFVIRGDEENDYLNIWFEIHQSSLGAFLRWMLSMNCYSSWQCCVQTLSLIVCVSKLHTEGANFTHRKWCRFVCQHRSAVKERHQCDTQKLIVWANLSNVGTSHGIRSDTINSSITSQNFWLIFPFCKWWRHWNFMDFFIYMKPRSTLPTLPHGWYPSTYMRWLQVTV